MASKETSPAPPKKDEPTAPEQEDGAASDPELEDLLDRSLGEFGKHIPKEKTPPPKPKPPPTLPPSTEAEFNEVFGEEFAAQTETQLGEAIKMMQSENPELWKQFEEFSKSLEKNAGAAFNVGGVASRGESSVDDSGEKGAGQERVGEKGAGQEKVESLAEMLDETLQKLKENAAGAESSNLFGGEEGDEDQLLKMMQGMMDSLLSKDVLYPALQELCKQYPDWLREHESELSPEDHQRYSKQLEIMRTICGEFESRGDTPTKASSDRILSLMQELQQYGQPPAELSTGNEGAGFLPPGIGDFNPQNCPMM